ncbi:MAG: penicillin-binding protein 2 [Candidatus Moranbacteria bacterium]|nr:penicillin-binding protein 2 [Candidatus Moranbacteria bacterium]
MKLFNSKRKKNEFGEIDVSDNISILDQDNEQRKIEEPVGLKNLKIFFVLIVFVLLIITSKAAYLQIVRGAYYADKAENNRISRITIKAPRGIIVDKKLNPLVENVASSDAVIVADLLPKDLEKRAEVLRKCFNAIDFKNPDKTVSMPDLKEFNQNPFQTYLIKENISRDELISINLHKNECPGFRTEETAVRNYLYPLEFSHILGYTGKVTQEDLQSDRHYLMTDITGRTGLEYTWEEELRGIHGAYNVEVDSLGKILRRLDESLPKFGSRLVLGIDKDFQIKNYEIIQKTIQKRMETQKEKQDQEEAELPEIRNASVVAIDPQNGLVRSIISFPGFDNNLFSHKIDSDKYQQLIDDPAKPLFNRAIAGSYPPGSTIKPLMGIAVLEEDVISPQRSFDCHGSIKIGEWEYRDWKTHGADIDMRKAIAESCDVYFYIVGGGYEDFKGLGIEGIGKYCKKFNLGEKTGIDLKGEKTGFIPDPEWKLDYKNEKWYVGNTYHVSIGQGDLSATPLQIANYVTAVANGGTLYQPHIVSEIIDEQSNETIERIEPEIVRKNFVDSSHIEVIKEGMKRTVESGTAQALNDLGIEIAGKTGTAQIGGKDSTHSWFVGFAPYDDPEIVLAVLVEEGGESSDAAVPAAREIFKAYFGIEEEQIKEQDSQEQETQEQDAQEDKTQQDQADQSVRESLTEQTVLETMVE